jgi:hypothetical protein
LVPLHLGVISGDAQHALVDIDPGDSAEFLAGQSHAGGDKARAASDVQDPVAILWRAGLDQFVREGANDLTSKPRIEAGGIATQLIAAHRFLPPFLLFCNRSAPYRSPHDLFGTAH